MQQVIKSILDGITSADLDESLSLLGMTALLIEKYYQSKLDDETINTILELEFGSIISLDDDEVQQVISFLKKIYISSNNKRLGAIFALGKTLDVEIGQFLIENLSLCINEDEQYHALRAIEACGDLEIPNSAFDRFLVFDKTRNFLLEKKELYKQIDSNHWILKKPNL